MQSHDLNVTGVRRAPLVDRRTHQREGAEGIYRTVSSLDMLPTGAQKHLALVFEWAIDGIRRQIEINRTPELEALHAAYTYAHDVLVATLRKPSVDS